MANIPAGEKENPDALAGAIGAVSKGLPFKSEHYRNRVARATVLCDAIAAADPRDACKIMNAALSQLAAGQPKPPLFSFMDEAANWADLASVPELKAYLLACYTRLSSADQQSFLDYVQGRAAA